MTGPRLGGFMGLQSHVPVQDAPPPSLYFLGTLMTHEMDGPPMASSQSRPGPLDIASVLATADPKPKEYAELGMSVDSDRLRRVVSVEARPSRCAKPTCRRTDPLGPVPRDTGGLDPGSGADTAQWHAGSVEDHLADPEPPSRIQLGLEEALDLLAALEEARDALIETDHLAEAVQVEHQIQLLSRRLGFNEPGGRHG